MRKLRATMGATEPLLHPCPNCAALVDVSEQQPFDQVHCPMCGTSMRVRTQFNNFSLQEILGAGGMGAVYKALDLNLQRMVALKVVRKEFSSDPEYLEKFEREARITASVNHPHVVKVFSFGSDHGLFYIAMELVDKGSLDELMNLQGTVSELQVLQVGIQVAQGLEAAHRCGLIHRDVKPGNILFADPQTAKIVDFGLALLAEQEAEARGEVWGTPYYVAPEKLNHEPEDLRSDIYSLGGTLFHAIAGRPPYEAETASMVALKHIKSQPVSLQAFAPEVSSATAYVINRMLHKDPQERYQSYGELIEHLTYARTQLEESLNKPRTKTRVGARNRAQELVFALMTLVLLCVLGGFGYFVYSMAKKGGAEHEEEVQPTPIPTPVVEEVKAPEPTPAPADRYKTARARLAEGKIQEARQQLDQLASESLSQPLQSWVVMHRGLIAFLEGRAAEGRQFFKQLRDAGPFSSNLEDRPLAGFFVQTAKIMADPELQGERAVLNKENYEALALFLFALSDFEIGRFEHASELLAAFERSSAQPPFDWISAYKPLAVPYANQIALMAEIRTKISEAATLEQKRATLSSVQEKVPALGNPSLKVAAQELLQALSMEINEADKELQEADAAAYEAGLAIFKRAATRYDFAGAARGCESIKVSTPEKVAQLNALLRKAIWLQKFQRQLAADVSAKAYPFPILKKNGSRFAVGANAADAQGIELRTRYGVMEVKWEEIIPNMLLAMAEHYLKAETDASQAAERSWLMGVFAFQFGMEKEGREWLLKASKENEKYRNDLGLFFDTATLEQPSH